MEYPDHATALSMRALLFQQAGKPSQALECLQQLSSVAKRNYAVFLCEAIIHYNRKDFYAAVTAVEKALEVDPTSGISLFVAYKSNLALRKEVDANSYLTLLKKYGNTLPTMELQGKAFLLGQQHFSFTNSAQIQ